MPRSTKSVVETPMEAPLPKTNGSPETSPRPIESLTQTIQDTGGDALAAPAPTLIPSEIGTAIATGWAYNQQVSWLWTNSSPRNAYAYVNGTGWRRVGGASDAGHDAITLLASVARASGKPIHLYENADTTIGAAYL